MRIAESARTHGVADENTRHAIRNAIRQIDMGENLIILIGPACNGALLEVGVLGMEDEDPVAIHSMPLRDKFHRFLA